jgi:hypothetical protein
MVWIETNTGDGILNDEVIERIYCEPPRNLNKSFEFYAQVNGHIWVIYAVNIPKKITKLAKDKEITDELDPKITEMADELFKKLMSFIFDAKQENNNQVICLADKFSESDFFK